MKSKTRKKLRELQRRIEAVEARLPAEETEPAKEPPTAVKPLSAAKGSSQA